MKMMQTQVQLILVQTILVSVLTGIQSIYHLKLAPTIWGWKDS